MAGSIFRERRGFLSFMSAPVSAWPECRFVRLQEAGRAPYAFRRPSASRRDSTARCSQGDAGASAPTPTLAQDVLNPSSCLSRRGGAVSYTHLRAHETPEHLVC